MPGSQGANAVDGKRCPLLQAAVAMAAGIVAGAQVWRPMTWWLAGVVVMVVGAGVFAQRRNEGAQWIARASVLAAFVMLGALCEQLHGAGSAGPESISAIADGTDSVVTGVVVRENPWEGLVRDGQRFSIDVRSEEIEHDGKTLRSAAVLRVNVYGEGERTEGVDAAEGSAEEKGVGAEAARGLEYGRRIRFRAKLREPRNYGNPGAMDYKRYATGQGISGLASARWDRIEVLKTGDPKPEGFTEMVYWRGLRSRIRRSLVRRVAEIWRPDDAALMAAMVLGDSSQIDRATKVDFQKTGTYHVLVVSGMNVSILAMVVFWILRKLRVGEMVATALTIALALGYAYVTDAGDPILRATLMLGIYLVMRLLYRERSGTNAVGFAALVVLAAHPGALFEASFQLTFMAVLAIAGMAAPVMERTSQPYRTALQALDSTQYDAKLEPRLAQFRVELRMVQRELVKLGGKQAAWVAPAVVRSALGTYEVLLLGLLMQVALALPMAVYFHRATLAGLPANAMVVPLTGMLMPAATAAMALAYVWVPLGKIAGMVAMVALHGITLTARGLGGARFAEVLAADPARVAAGFAAVAFGFAMAAMGRRKSVAWASAGALMLSAVGVVAWHPAKKLTGKLEVTAIDVGQGDSILVVAPDGKTLLVDAGGLVGPGAAQSSFDVGEDVVSPYLWSRGMERLDAIALTHAHSDHIGGMRKVIANFRPRELWVGVNAPSRAYEEMLQEAALRGTRVVRHVRGDGFEFGGAMVRVLSPGAEWQSTERGRNNDSLVLKMTMGATSVLLSGDMEKKVERAVALEDVGAQVLKVSHHGSGTSTTPELLAAVRPTFAVISVGARSPFGHPKIEVLRRLQAAGARTYRTDVLGAVTMELDGRVVVPRVRTQR